MEDIVDENKSHKIEEYEKPSIVFEGRLEVQAGSPVGDFDDGLNWGDL